MSRPTTSRIPSAPMPPRLSRPSRSLSVPGGRASIARRPSVSAVPRAAALPATSGAKAQRTSKTTQKLVLLPSAPQTKPLPPDEDDDFQHGYETDRGIRDVKSDGEKMSKEQRQKAGFKRITAYCVAEGLNMKLLSGFLKREHNVQLRIFDEAMHAMYYLPLLPGYGPNANIRSSAAPAPTLPTEDPLGPVSEAEEVHEDTGYFSAPSPSGEYDAFMPSISPGVTHISDTEATQLLPVSPRMPVPTKYTPPAHTNDFAEAVFFAYGVIVFFGLSEAQEHGILEDITNTGVMQKPLVEDRWEIEECHYEYNPNIAYPRIYNDFFTFKSHSVLLTVSVAHALAQSTLLARYETITHSVLSSPATTSIPTQLASTGSLKLSRKDALKQTGRLFKLRRDVNLVSNVLDVPDLFWEEGQASLRALYDAVRDYMEISTRVGVLNEKLAVAEDLLGAIHDHLNNNAMDRITWIIIWLIVAACLVEFGEVIARLVVHATNGGSHEAKLNTLIPDVSMVANMTGEEALQALQQLALMRK